MRKIIDIELGSYRKYRCIENIAQVYFILNHAQKNKSWALKLSGYQLPELPTWVRNFIDLEYIIGGLFFQKYSSSTKLITSSFIEIWLIIHPRWGGLLHLRFPFNFLFSHWQVINGLMEREDWEKAIKMPIGTLPGGSGNALCVSMLFAAGYVALLVISNTYNLFFFFFFFFLHAVSQPGTMQCCTPLSLWLNMR